MGWFQNSLGTICSSPCFPLFSLRAMFGLWRVSPSVATSDDIGDSSVHSDSTDGVINLKGDKLQDESALQKLNLSYIDLWALALTTSIGGHYLGWCSGLTAGFGTFMIATILIATGFICMLCCMSELASAIPFAGGAYGIARVTLGIYPGYLVACADTFKSIVTVANIAVNIGRMITIASSAHERYEPIYWVIFYAGCIAVHSYGGRMQWLIIRALAGISVLLLLVYLIGSAQFGNLTKNAALDSDVNTPYEQWFHGGMHEFMHVLPRAGLFFTGIQNINLACREIREPKSEVPKAYMAGLGTGLLTSFSTVLVACSLSPGVSYLKTRLYPLSTGYMLMFEITRPHAIIISLPAVIAAGLGFVYFYGQKLRAMGESRLMNPICAGELPGRHTPINALLIGSVLSFALCMLEYFKPEVGLYLYNISVMGAFFTYMSIFLSFLSFRAYYPTIAKEFKSPLGAAGAYYGMAVFALAIVSICGFQKKQVSITTFSCVLGVAILYYYWAVEKRQVFSEEEKKVMFKAYLLKGNASKATRLKKGARAGRGARGEVPTPRSDNAKKEVSTTIVYKAAPTETMSAPAVYLSDEEEQLPAPPRGTEEPTYQMTKQGVEEGVTAAEQEHENKNDNEDGSEHDVPELPV